MSFRLSVGLLAVVAVVGPAAAQKITGSGKVKTESREIGEVKKVDISGNGTLKITFGDKPALEVTADDNILPILLTEAKDGTLTVQTKKGANFSTRKGIKYQLTVKALDEITVDGVASVEVDGIKADKFTLNQPKGGAVKVTGLEVKELTVDKGGSAATTLSGAADKVTATIKGAGAVDATGLKAKTVAAKTEGVAKLNLGEVAELTATADGASEVTYKGDPKVKQTTKGVAKVRKAD